MAHFPNAELVAVAWVKSVPGVDPTKVATSLPADTSVWSATGFVQVGVVGGSPNVDTPLFAPVVQVDCWTNAVNSNKPPWGQAHALAGAIMWATYRHEPTTVAMPENYHPARLLSVYGLSEPRRIPSDTAGYARVQFDLAMVWTVTA